ncbi:hypothetical protein H5S09_04075 [Limosilactobacillus sp. STM2_1]|uniref:Uncharacterized protein n=1 Tax=Limosilactobacillus rudii TaxID=2759755 RepID=A0A7W3UK68_9LACO|nr:hypothetical protein [Limosilactobacillus rudii]MBB1078940.1 hypothetical protein [Limosilactobacillus rudii]MBB1097121.1 hypothetical protein [Limosilactobacillus rudii]MCD7134114.1 hypothetical protein [Limosilactobacillus rudii]
MDKERLRIAKKEELRDQLLKLGWKDIKSFYDGYTFYLRTPDKNEHWLTIVDKGTGKNFSSSFGKDIPLKLYTATMALINQWMMPEEKSWVLFLGKDSDDDGMYLLVDDEGMSIEWAPVSYTTSRLEELKQHYPRLEKVIDLLKMEE